MASNALAIVSVPDSTYRVTWRIGESGIVDHIVRADTAGGARQLSEAILRDGAGTAFDAWRFESVIKRAERAGR